MKFSHLLYAWFMGLMCAATTQAGFVDTVQTSVAGTINDYQDTSREAVFYHDRWGGVNGIQAGDVVIGFNEIKANNTTGADTTNTIYSVFSETVQSITGGTTQSGGYVTGGTSINFEATSSSDPLSLQNILSGLKDSNGNSISPIPTGTIFALFDLPQGQTMPNVVATGLSGVSNMSQIIQKEAQSGVYEFAGGIGTSGFDFLNAQIALTGPATSTLTNDQAKPGTLSALASGATFADFSGGLSILQNNTGIVFGPDSSIGNGHSYQLVITLGANQGASNLPNYKIYSSGAGAAVADGATFEIDAISPEPSSIILFGFGMAGLAGAGLRRKKKNTVAA